MSRNGPLFTLLGGGALAAVLLVTSINASNDEPPSSDPALAGGAAEQTPATPDATGEATPDGTPEPDPSADPGAGVVDEEEAVTYVGWTDDDEATVAIIVEGDEATAYVCDGDAVEVWLRGDASDGALNLTADDGDVLTGGYDQDQAEGETTAAGFDYDFTIERVDAPEGLYQVAATISGAEVDGGWIVLPDGTQVGLLTVDGVTQPAPALDPGTGQVTIDGRLVVAGRLGG
ncbi:hypothetical protein JQS43_14845 [Natronosporangium hydrolyticum]|uniref:Uncharacterized protein n=1 Tax=Natronosporangium hydrolyticum TaxID=2811111 RepID=A0A895Y9F4_9ACTN|nr:hypothetical protein [Natronosporangium hydrolyticum]QSB12945.1 hypothetical protein JQS43_14845 [Natronosporangium hydrolyticum]